MTRFLLSMTAVCLLTATTAMGESAVCNAGLSQGDGISAFYVTKVAGAEEDGVEAGDSLCYRCRYGSRPMVMVFTRSTDDSVAKLVTEIDSAVAAHESDQLKGLVTLIGGEAGELKSQGEAMAKKSAVKNVPVVVAKDIKAGPKSYKISPGAAVTVLLVSDSQVYARHNFDAEKVDVAAVMGEVTKMLN